MTNKLKTFMASILIVAVAALTGLSVGKIYVDHLEAPVEVGASVESITESEDKVLGLVERSKKEGVTSFSPLELYLIAEHNLYNAEEFYKIMTGLVKATAGVEQKMKGERLKTGGKLYYNKLSPSTSAFAPQICSRIVYDYATDAIQLYEKGDIINPQEEDKTKFVGVFDAEECKNLSLEDYQNTFNTHPSRVMPYIVSSITCGQNMISSLTDNGNGTYSFQIKMDGTHLEYAAMCYSYEIKFSSGMADKPKWEALTMDVTIDSNFNFVQIKYEEVYKMKAPVIDWTRVTDLFVDEFHFTDIPSVEYVLREVA